MRPPAVKVTETVEDGGMREIIRKHPAFGTIAASRVTGKATLAGSPLQHTGYINIRISYADERVSYTHSHFYSGANGGIVELSISEAQWAAFVSTLNVGCGVPCTLEYVRDGNMKRLPLIEDESYEEKRAKDIQRRVKEQQEQLDAAVHMLDAMISEGITGKTALRKLRQMFIQPVDNAPRNAEFLAEMLTEHAEGLVESAKAEVSAMVTRMSIQFPQLEGRGVEIRQIEDKSKE